YAHVCYLLILPGVRCTFFPYTTLFRSREGVMPSRSLDAFATLAAWQALESDGTTPSTAIVVDEDLALDTPGGDRHSIRLAFSAPDRKSTRLNSSHVKISYAVFCLKKKK